MASFGGLLNFAPSRGEGEKSTGTSANFADVRAVEVTDLQIVYQKGDTITYIRPLTIQGRHWLWDHVKYPYCGSNAIVDAERLLVLIQ